MQTEDIKLIAEALNDQAKEINTIENNQDRWKAQDILGKTKNKIAKKLNAVDTAFFFGCLRD